MTVLESYIKERYWGFDYMTIDQLCDECLIPVGSNEAKIIKELIRESIGRRKVYMYERIEFALFYEIVAMMVEVDTW